MCVETNATQGWGWYFLSTILDDYTRHIITCRLTTNGCR